MAGVLAVTAFFCGAYALMSQSYLAREFLVVFLGNEMSLALLLAGWLAGVASGARLARAKIVAGARPAFVLLCALPAWVVIFPVAVLVVRLSRAIFGVTPGMLAPFWKLLLASFLLAGPFAAFVGFTFVTVCRVWQAASAERGGRAVGLVYVAEALGGVTGGAVFTFVLAGRAGPFSFALAAYPVLGVLVVYLAAAFVGKRLLPRGLGISLGVGTGLVAAVGGGLAAAGRGAVLDWNTHVARMATIADGVVMSGRESRYQNVTAMLLSGQYTIYGNGEAMATFPERLLAEREAYLVLAERGAPADVLVVGGGGEFVAAVVSYGVERVDYVELDPAAVEIAAEFLEAAPLAALESPGVRIHYGDARRFMAEAARRGGAYDVIFVRAPAPSTLLVNRLYTQEFMLDARACLREGGVFAVPVTLAGSYLGGEVGRYAGDIYRTMESVFDEVLATPEIESVFLASAGAGVLTSSVEELSRRFGESGARSSLYPDAFGLAFPPERTESTNDELKALPESPVNTDWRPTTYAANLALWAKFSASPIGGWLAGLAKWPPWLLFGVVLLLACAAAGLVFVRTKASSASALGVFYTGWAAMSMTVLLLYAFQVTCGYVYEWIGVLAGAFMAGTVVGGLSGTFLGRGIRRMLAAEAAVLASPLIVAGALWVAKDAVSPSASAWLVVGLTGLAGLVTGFEFPVAAAVLRRGGATAGAAGGALETADHLGACLGAILTGVALAAALGIWWSLMLVAAVKCVSAVCVLRAARVGGAFG